MNYIDFHCDTLGMFGKGPDQGNLYENSGSLDLKRMKEAGCLAQFFCNLPAAGCLAGTEGRAGKGRGVPGIPVSGIDGGNSKVQPYDWLCQKLPGL